VAIFVPTLTYFEPLCHKVFDSYFYQNSFNPIPVRHPGRRVVYSNDEEFCGFGYYDQGYPKFEIIIAIGLMNRSTYNPESAIGLMYDIPKSDTSANYWCCFFHDSPSLEELLTRIRDQVLPVYAKPLWDDPERLRQLLVRVAESQEAAREARQTEQKRKLAVAAFQKGNFGEALGIYNEMSAVDYLPSDKKRIEIALKRVGIIGGSGDV